MGLRLRSAHLPLVAELILVVLPLLGEGYRNLKKLDGL